MVTPIAAIAPKTMNMEFSLSKTTYKAQVYSILEEMIVYGKLKPGQRLIESELAAALGVSRSPVREAIIALGQEGLVSQKVGYGWIVSEISLQSIVESYEVRKVIEIHSGKKGCVNCSTEILNEMKSTLDNLEKPIKLHRYQKINRRFHELIVLSSGNKKLHEAFLWTIKNIRWCGSLTMGVAWRKEIIALEHRRIQDAFISKDPDCLAKAIEDHISSVQNIISTNWDNPCL